jgi:hypothetical protein
MRAVEKVAEFDARDPQCSSPLQAPTACNLCAVSRAPTSPLRSQGRSNQSGSRSHNLRLALIRQALISRNILSQFHLRTRQSDYPYTNLTTEFEANRRPLHSVAYRLLSSLTEAEDVVQET